MEGPGALVQEMLTWSGLTPSGVARRAGVSGSTLHRILNDQVDPSFGTLREVAIACGLQLSLATAHLSEPLAASAARSMLEENYQPPAGPQVTQWRERLPRLAGGNGPIEIMKVAARASSPLDRPGAALYWGEVQLARLASAGDASGKRWGVSGAAGLYLPSDGDVAPPVTILWCEDVRAVDHLLVGSGLRPTHRADRARLAVVAAEPELFSGSFARGIVRYVAPIQILLDCISQTGQVADDAIDEATSW
ncbi:MAG TPA: helix-turn-helix transcriptional regulator [Acidimicrobiales bacterium]|nr:helix-turn-helix transcriptional regulator [Acidimicrobiales bacterium]